jgi:hypothetical protein
MWYSAWVLDGMAVVCGLIGSSKAEGFHTGVFFWVSLAEDNYIGLSLTLIDLNVKILPSSLRM